MISQKPPQSEEAHSTHTTTNSHYQRPDGRIWDDLLELLNEWELSTDTHAATHLLAEAPWVNPKSDELRHRFGERPFELCLHAKNILNPAKSRNATARSLRAEHLRRCYYLGYTDQEALLFTLALRLVSLGNIDNFTPEQRHQWAKENLTHYSPVFDWLGLRAYTQILGDISLRLLDKSSYQALEAKIETYYNNHHTTLLRFQQQLENWLSAHPLGDVKIKPIALSPAYLYIFEHDNNTLLPHHKQLPLHLVVDILLDDEHDCYTLLGILHQHLLPTKTITDHLANPHFNGYRTLTSTLKYDDTLITVNIRTHIIEKVNDYGIIAAKRANQSIRNVWWDMPNRQTVSYKPSDKQPFGVFTPDGRWIYPLPKGFNVLDFAFRIHSELGAYARNFWINGKPAAHHHMLHHTDLVEIEFDRTTTSINETWLELASSSKTRRAIKNFLKRHSSSHQTASTYSTGAERIMSVLEREMCIYKLRFSTEQIEEKLQKWASLHQYADVNAVYKAVERGEVTADEVVCALIEEEFTPHIIRADGKRLNTARIRLCRCWMMAEENLKWSLQSRITFDTPIVGRIIGKDKPFMMVHRADCLNAPAPEEAIQLCWQKPATKTESAEFIIHAPLRLGISGIVLDKFEALQKNNVKLVIHRFQTETNAHQTNITCTITAPNIDIITKLQEEFRILQERGDIFDFSIWGLFHSEHLRLSGKLDKRQHNPYTLKQIRDQTMFFGRDEEIKRIIQYLREGETFIVLYGQKRIGKTSLMEHLANHLIPRTLSNDFLPIFFDALSLAPFNTQTLLRGLIETAIPVITRVIKRATLPTDLRLHPSELYQNPFTYFAEWVKRVEKRLSQRRLLFMIDEFTRAEEEYQRHQIDESFFSGMQWLAGNQHIGFFICVHDHIYRDTTSRSWGFLQRAHPLYLHTLDRVAAQKLIQLPLQSLYQFEEGLVDKIIDLTYAHPYFIQAICLELSVYMSQQEAHRISEKDLDVVIQSILINGKHYFHHFYDPKNDQINHVLKCIAFLADDANHSWVEREQIQETMLTKWQIDNRMSISESIGRLYQAGIIEAKQTSNKVSYRIPIKLFQHWLRRETHPLIHHDIHRNQ